MTLFHGDCLDVLRGLPSGSVHMCATSPPFYGLRDYGTGSWEGGDPDCDHSPEQPEPIAYDNGQGESYTTNNQNWNKKGRTYAGNQCPKCGARRVDQQIGLEETPDQWVERLVAVFREVRRVLRDDGVLFVEIGDSYCANDAGKGRPNEGHVPNAWQHRDVDIRTKGGAALTPMKHPTKPKDLLGQPWLLAFALRADGWWLRSEIIWARPNPMPESVTDRPTKAHSTVFLLSKQPRYFYDADAIREPAKRAGDIPMGAHDRAKDGYTKPGWGHGEVPSHANARSVWTLPTEPTPFAHFATWPQALVRRMILAGSPQGGTVLDPFAGSATTCLVARNTGRRSIGIELNEQYLHIAAKRLQQLSLLHEGTA